MRAALIIFLIATALFVQGCEGDIFFPGTPTAVIEAGHWEQPYYQYSAKWGSVVEVWYTIRNTGSIDIDYWKVWFKVICVDGSEYQDWSSGTGLDVGHTMTDITHIAIPSKEVLTGEVMEFELTAW